MSRAKKIAITGFVVVILAAIPFFRPSRPVLLTISPDPTMVRPRSFCIMNPLRDRTPERASEAILSALRGGRIEALQQIPLQREREDVIESEKKWPIRSWRIGRRRDTGERSQLMYWVRRGNGYAHEEEVYFDVDRGRVVSYGAIY